MLPSEHIGQRQHVPRGTCLEHFARRTSPVARRTWHVARRTEPRQTGPGRRDQTDARRTSHVASTSATTIATHSATTYRTVKYLVQCTQGTDYHSTEINLIHDGTTVYITEYGTLYDNAVLGTFDASISGGNILLKITAGSATSMGIKVVSTAIPV